MAVFHANVLANFRDFDNDSSTDPTFTGSSLGSFDDDFNLETTFIDEVFTPPDSIEVSGDQNFTNTFVGTIKIAGSIFFVLSGTGGTYNLLGNVGVNFNFPQTLDIGKIVSAPKELTEFDDTWNGNGAGNSVNLLEGNDFAHGRGGADMISGNLGRDAIHGNRGNDVLLGGSGNDNLWGEKGTDFLGGGNGKDYLNGGKGKDSLSGDAGDDELIGGLGNDWLDGGGKNDTLDGGRGNDDLTGGTYGDRFIFRGDFGNDTIHDFKTAGNKEKIDISTLGEIRGIKDLRNNHLTDETGGVLIEDHVGNSIKLIGVSAADLSANDFLFPVL